MIRIIKRYTSIFRTVKIPWGIFCLLIFLTLVKSHTEVESLTLTASIIDGTQGTIKFEELYRYILFLVINSILVIGTTYVTGLFSQKINLAIRMRLWNKMMHLPTKYYDGEQGGNLVTRVTTDADSASQYFSVGIQIFTSVYAGVVAYLRMYQFQSTMAKSILGVIPLVIILTIVYSIIGYRASAHARTTLAATMGYLAERVRGLRLIKSFSMEQKEYETARNHFKRQCKSEILLSYASMIEMAGMQLIGCINVVLAFLMGSQLLASGEISVGKLIGFYTISSLFTVRCVGVCTGLGNFSKNAGVMDKICEVLNSPEESEAGAELDVQDEDLVLNHVSFSYRDVPVLQDISCVIPKGKVTAIVGTNGAGKSTLFKLLERMYQPDTGEICFGTTPIEQFSIASWRKSFAIVSQDKPIMSGTVRENILYGVERTVGEEELVYIAKMANIYDVIQSLPEGFDTQVGPGGSNFSGGQQQCIAIARAMMRNPDYLLLDEATSNLDVKSESYVTDALKKLMKGRTTVMIAHKYSATIYADQIVVMNQGKIEAIGTPQTLLESNAYYQAFAKGNGRGVLESQNR